MGIESIGAEIAREWRVIQQAPFAFLAIAAVLAFAIWKILQREFVTRLANASSTNEMLRERLERSETSDALTIAAVQQQHEVAPSSRSIARSESVDIEPPGPKEFIGEGVTLDHLMGIFEGRTDVQARAMLADQIGKWINIEGPVNNVNAMGKGIMVVLKTGDGGLIFCNFKEPSNDLVKLSVGTPVHIRGRIEELGPFTVMVEDCELLPL